MNPKWIQFWNISIRQVRSGMTPYLDTSPHLTKSSLKTRGIFIALCARLFSKKFETSYALAILAYFSLVPLNCGESLIVRVKSFKIIGKRGLHKTFWVVSRRL